MTEQLFDPELSQAIDLYNTLVHECKAKDALIRECKAKDALIRERKAKDALIREAEDALIREAETTLVGDDAPEHREAKRASARKAAAALCKTYGVVMWAFFELLKTPKPRHGPEFFQAVIEGVALCGQNATEHAAIVGAVFGAVLGYISLSRKCRHQNAAWLNAAWLKREIFDYLAAALVAAEAEAARVAAEAEAARVAEEKRVREAAEAEAAEAEAARLAEEKRLREAACLAEEKRLREAAEAEEKRLRVAAEAEAARVAEEKRLREAAEAEAARLAEEKRLREAAEAEAARQLITPEAALALEERRRLVEAARAAELDSTRVSRFGYGIGTGFTAGLTFAAVAAMVLARMR